MSYHYDVDQLDTIMTLPAGISRPHIIHKDWGYEKVHINDLYCMKELVFVGHKNKLKAKPGTITTSDFCTSMHFHLKKHETIYVVKGILHIDIIVNKKVMHIEVPEGHSYVIPPGHPHRLIAQDELILLEASTFDDAKDSIRIG